MNDPLEVEMFRRKKKPSPASWLLERDARHAHFYECWPTGFFHGCALLAKDTTPETLVEQDGRSWGPVWKYAEPDHNTLTLVRDEEDAIVFIPIPDDDTAHRLTAEVGLLQEQPA
jgi:hypothetical protein